MMWLITNIDIAFATKMNKLKCKGFNLYTDKQIKLSGESKSFLFYDGYVLPRLGSSKGSNFDEAKLQNLADTSPEFIRSVKGNFTIIKGDENHFEVYSDRFGVNKWFFYNQDDRFVITNDFKIILQTVQTSISIDSIAIYALGYHYLGGKTLFDHIELSKPAAILQYKDGNLTESTYWSPKELLTVSQQTVEIPDIAEVLEKNIEQQLNSAVSDKVSHSVTGGFDSRILLSILLKLGVEVHGYTYGNPKSSDCVIASIICRFAGIPHAVHDISFTPDSFSEWAKLSIDKGHSVCSLHRAHRIAAIQKEAEYADTMFLGTMGGEFIKGANRDDYIVSNFVYDYCENQSEEIIRSYMKRKGLLFDEDSVERVGEFFREQNYIKYKKDMEHFALCEIATGMHHGQNNIQYGNYVSNAFTPFLDIDYLELLFASKFNFLYRRRNQSPKEYKLNNPLFGSNMQYHLNRELAEIPYANGFSAKDYLFNPLYAGFKAKVNKKIKKYPPTFPLGKWFADFTKRQLQEISESDSIVKDTFDLKSMLEELNRGNLPHIESFWLKYSTPIQIYLTLQSYGIEKC